MTSVHVLLPFAFKVLCTRLIVSMLRGSDYVGHPNESLARGSVLLTANYRMQVQAEDKDLHSIPQA